MELRLGEACTAILSGYQSALEKGGTPFVLEENHPQLRRLAYAKERDPAIFWMKLTRLLSHPEADPPAEARAALLHDLPAKGLLCQFRIRPHVGVGSLGKPRYIVVLAEWAGGWVAREAKALAPAASDLARRRTTARFPADRRGRQEGDPLSRPVLSPGQAVDRATAVAALFADRTHAAEHCRGSGSLCFTGQGRPRPPMSISATGNRDRRRSVMI